MCMCAFIYSAVSTEKSSKLEQGDVMDITKGDHLYSKRIIITVAIQTRLKFEYTLLPIAFSFYSDRIRKKKL